jgi:hypothetical protein
MVSNTAKNALGVFISVLLLLYLWKPQPFFTEDGNTRPGYGTSNSTIFNMSNLTAILAVVCFFICVSFETPNDQIESTL